MTPDLERLVSHIRLNGDCWESAWIDHNGYGRYRYKGRKTRLHRAIWEELVGPCPPGLEPDHYACHNRACANPDHIEWVTHAENMRRTRRTFCKYGHTMSDAYINNRGGRQCRTCAIERTYLHDVQQI